MVNFSIKILEIFNEILEISTDMFDTIFTLDFTTKTLNKIKKMYNLKWLNCKLKSRLNFYGKIRHSLYDK